MQKTVRGQLFELNKTLERFTPTLSLHEKAKKASDLIAQDKNVIASILFGSIPKQTANSQSDIDLLIITTEKTDRQTKSTTQWSKQKPQ